MFNTTVEAALANALASVVYGAGHSDLVMDDEILAELKRAASSHIVLWVRREAACCVEVDVGKGGGRRYIYCFALYLFPGSCLGFLHK